MPLPASWPTVLVHGTYLRLDGTPNNGSVWFETDQPTVVTDATGTVIGVLPKRQIAPLDKNGHFEIALPCTDAGGTPTGWTYQVSEKFDGGQDTYSIEVPQSLVSNGINLAQYPHATPVPVNPPVVTYLRTADIGVTVASQTDMNAANANANAALAQAAAAVTTANAASATADNALTVANAIDAKAQTALDNSNAAVATANNALTVANGIDAKAQTALDNSAAAVTTANTANTNANNAVTTANGIDAKAQSALDASATANTNANNAVTTANAASAAVASKLDATANAVSASKWQTARNLTLTGAITAALNNVDGTANVSAAASITNRAVTLAKIDPSASTTGQVLMSAGNASDPVWSNLMGGFKNKLINGNFDFWQRGTSLAAFSNSLYLADRFLDRSNGSTIAPSRQPFVAGSTETAAPANYYHSAVVASTAGAGNYAFSEHRIEGVANSSGRTMTLTVYARGPAGAKLGIGFSQLFGTGGSPSAAITGISATNVTLTTAFQKFTFTLTYPSIAGKTLGTNGDDYYGVEFWYDAGTSFASRAGGIGQQSGTFDIAQVQLEEGSVATAFEMRPLGAELALCQRYYEKSYQLSIAPGAVNDTNGTAACVIGGLASGSYSAQLQGNFKVAKRAAPTITLYSPATGAGGVIRNFSAAADFSPASVQIGTNMVQINTGAMAAAASINVQAHWTASAEL